MDPHVAGRTAHSLETLHALGYFAAEVEDELTTLGLKRGRMCYFASRSAPMGQVSAGTVAATFFVFHPGLVARFIPAAWSVASPEAITTARYQGVSAAWERLVGDLDSPEVQQAAELARTAAEACSVSGRPLAAAHAGLPWPDDAHLVLFHALTVLREHRGDGHVAALLGADLSGVEALVTHTATGRGFTVPAAKATRGWSDEEWDAAVSGLADRGVMSADGTLTDRGQQLRRDVEEETDRMAAQPWAAIGEDGVRRLGELCLPMVRRALANGAFPDGVFA